MSFDEALRAVTARRNFPASLAEAVMGEIIEGTVPATRVAFLLGGMAAKGFSAAEVAGFALALRKRMVPVNAQVGPLIDNCGTGGDTRGGMGTFNVSTAAALIAAGAGARIAKHGNRSVSSRSGSSDVLEKLGVRLELSPEAIARCIEEVGIGFMFAPLHHPAFKSVAPLRKELGVRTIFNFLGPLANPASAARQVVGVPDPDLIEIVAGALLELGCERALVLHARDGMDEFSTCSPTDYVELFGGRIYERQTLLPSELGLACVDPAQLAGGSAEENATIIQQLLHDGRGPCADIACLNAAAVLLTGEFAADWKDALQLARAALSSGAALETLARLRAFTQNAAP
jgi:anthranilate phosphoribosyltransferase